MTNKSNYRKQNSGFTLIEMIVTVSIVAILVSIAAPSFRTMLETNRISSATNELVGGLLLARSEALKRRSNVSVCASSDQSICDSTDFATGWVVFINCSPTSTDGVPDAAIDCNGDGDTTDANDKNTIIKVHGPLNRMEVDKLTGNSTYHTYKFSGRVEANTTFDVKSLGGSGTHTKMISVNRTGRLKTD